MGLQSQRQKSIFEDMVKMHSGVVRHRIESNDETDLTSDEKANENNNIHWEMYDDKAGDDADVGANGDGEIQKYYIA